MKENAADFLASSKITEDLLPPFLGQIAEKATPAGRKLLIAAIKLRWVQMGRGIPVGEAAPILESLTFEKLRESFASVDVGELSTRKAPKRCLVS